MSPEAVAEYLKRRAGQSKDEARDDSVDEQAEEALRSRAHPLINLALARYGRHMSTLSALFRASPPNHANRLATLCNTSCSLEIFNHHPVGFLGGTAAIAHWLGEASPEELQALFENPSLDDDFLCDLLKRGKGWEAVSDDMLSTIVVILGRNKRMWTPRQDDYMDGYAEYSYGAVFNAAWKLAESVENSERWAIALGSLYERMEPDAFSIKDPLSIAARWRLDPARGEAARKEAEMNAKGWLGAHQRVRKGLARLALANKAGLLPELLADNDIALRCSAYAAGRLSPDQLTAALQRDGELVFTEARHNPWLWRSTETRAALKAVAWSVVENDKHSDLLAANIYNDIRKDMLRQHPDWFRDEEDVQPALDSGDGSATRADIAAVAEQVQQSTSAKDLLMARFGETLETINGRARWIWWFSLGALLASLKHF